MQETTNYKLKKPESNEFVSVDNLNYNADVLDHELEKLEINKVSADGGSISDTESDVMEPEDRIKYPEIQTRGGTVKTIFGLLNRWVNSLKESKVDIIDGDISNTKVSEFTASTAQYPVPATGDASKTLWGKVKKFCEDMNNLRASMVFVGSIVNNCVTDRADLPGSAAQLKVLMDLYNVLNANLSGKAAIAHASTSLSYGGGTETHYGHVKLSNSYNSPVGEAAQSIAASQHALYNQWVNVSSRLNTLELQHNGNKIIDASSGKTGVNFQLSDCGFYLILAQQGTSDNACGMWLAHARGGAVYVTTMKRMDYFTIIHSGYTLGIYLDAGYWGRTSCIQII